MVSLLEETFEAAQLRVGSVQQQLDKTRKKMRTRGVTLSPTGDDLDARLDAARAENARLKGGQ